LFGFPIDTDVTSEELLKSKRFLAHAIYFIQMIDTAVNMLGPDIELLTEIMIGLGAKHVRYGVTTSMFPILKESLLETLEEVLQGKFTGAMRDAWHETFDALSTDMKSAYGTPQQSCEN
jgi:hemoglobin-like flavoprotein